jgi:hypothetical protein
MVSGGLISCGGGGGRSIAVRVGRAAVSEAEVAHWTHVIELGGEVGILDGQAPGSPRSQALAFLISAQWLEGEATLRHVPVSTALAREAVAERVAAAPGGSSEFRAELRARGETLVDVESEAAAELASAAIERELAARAQVSPAELRDYYRRNRRLFRAPETRVVDIVERLPSRAAAIALIRRAGTITRFAQQAARETLRQTVLRGGSAEKEAVVRAILSARRGVLSRPMPLSHAWTVFVVRTITPPTVMPFSRVRGEIRARLVAERRRRLTAQFETGYQQRWRSRTSCRPKYVVPGCIQYAGPMERESLLAIG